MKLITLIIGITLLSFNSISQSDSITMGTSYTNQVFYSLKNGTVKTIDNNNWDLAFSAQFRGAAGSSILINEANVTLWAAPHDTSAWATFDTVGISSWERRLNSDTTWTNGAFNRYRGGVSALDMGWGVLQPSNNFWTFGDSIYVAKLSNGAYKKIWIISLKSGAWKFKYANINGTNEKIINFTKSSYPNRNFIYHSMLNDTTINREPVDSTWEITFAKHIDFVNPPGMYVNVTSVFNNVNVWSAKANGHSLAGAMALTSPQTNYNQNVTNIGREWKKFKSATGWKVKDSLAYFIYDYDSTDFYRIVFTKFGGSSTGKAFFNIQKIGTASVIENGFKTTISLYPNPATNYVTLLIDYPNKEKVTISICNITGQLVEQKEMELLAGINQKSMNLSNLNPGIYTVLVHNTKFNYSKKLVIR